jgi:hypothetical protein
VEVEAVEPESPESSESIAGQPNAYEFKFIIIKANTELDCLVGGRKAHFQDVGTVVKHPD